MDAMTDGPFPWDDQPKPLLHLRAAFVIRPDSVIEVHTIDNPEPSEAVLIQGDGYASVTIYTLGSDAEQAEACDRLIEALQDVRSRALARATKVAVSA